MITIAKRVLGEGFAFAATRPKFRRASAQHEGEEGTERDVFKAYRRQVEKGSILRQFREDVFRRADLAGDWNSQNAPQREQEKVQRLMEVDRESMLRRASNVEARAFQKRSSFDESTGRSLISDYGDYKCYNDVHPVVNDRNMGGEEYLQDSHITQNLYTFLDKLPDDYRQKEQVQAIINHLPVNQQKMTIAQYGKQVQKKLNDAQRKQLRKYEEYRIHTTHKYAVNQPPASEEDIDQGWFESKPQENYQFTGIVKTVDPETGEDGIDAQLSPSALDTIYDLYLQGWTVRDISKRFGILPARTKFCVWVRAQLYHEVIPKMGVKFYLRALRYQQRYNQQKTFCDYGLDIEQLSNDKVLMEINEWNSTMLDAQRRQDEYKGAMLRLEKEKKFSKYEMVEVGTFDKENSKYRMKEWTIFRGKGSDQYFLKNKLLQELTRAQKKFNKVYY